MICFFFRTHNPPCATLNVQILHDDRLPIYMCFCVKRFFVIAVKIVVYSLDYSNCFQNWDLFYFSLFV